MVFDNKTNDEELVKVFAWSYGSVSIQAILHDKRYEEQLMIVIDEDRWRLPCNRAPPRKHSEEKQREIRCALGTRGYQEVASH